MKKHAELCPVCKGTGKYKDYTNCNHTATIYVERTCHGCQGTGWVTVTDNDTPDYGTPYGGVIYNDVQFCDENYCHIPHID